MQSEIWSVVLSKPECAGLRELEELWRLTRDAQGQHSIEMMQYYQGIIEGMSRCHDDHVVRVLSSSMHDRVQLLIDNTRENVKAKAVQVQEAAGLRIEPALVDSLTGLLHHWAEGGKIGFPNSYPPGQIRDMAAALDKLWPAGEEGPEEGAADGD